MSDQYDAVIAGHICLDIIPDLSGSTLEQFRRTFAPGKLLQVGSAALGTGGAVSNVGLALHKLGMDVRLMGKVGDDAFGQIIRQIVASTDPRLADGMVVDASVGSSYTIVVNPPGVDRYFLHSPGANDTFVADDVRYDLLQQARLFHFGYPPLMRRMFEDDGVELIEIFRRAKQTGVTTSLDMALPDPSAPAGRANWIAILRATLPYVDIFLPSIEEILFMLRRETFDELERSAGSHGIVSVITPQLLSDVSAELLDQGAQIVGIKLGNRGFYLRTAGEQRAGIDGPRPSSRSLRLGEQRGMEPVLPGRRCRHGRFRRRNHRRLLDRTAARPAAGASCHGRRGGRRVQRRGRRHAQRHPAVGCDAPPGRRRMATVSHDHADARLAIRRGQWAVAANL